MRAEIKGAPTFAYLDIVLEPGERIVAESGAMSTMASDIELRSRLNGGLLPGLARKFLGGESLFISEFSNPGPGTAGVPPAPRRLTLTQSAPGDLQCLDLKGQSFYLQPGAFVACTPGVTLGLGWAGLASGIQGEGFFRLIVSGQGQVWFGAYGRLLERQVDGELIVDTDHLVGYEPSLSLRLGLAGGILSSVLGGEGLITRVSGKGKLYIQTRSIAGLAAWLRPRV